MPSDGDIVIVSNRLPVRRVGEGADAAWERSPGGLVSALTPILAERPSTWVGWAEDADASAGPFRVAGVLNHPVPVSAPELTAYYDGFSNRTLWPLFHDCIRPAEYHRDWWKSYVEVNRRFARTAAEMTSPGGVVWVHDYQLLLAPAMIRALRRDVRVGFFLHISFPPQELFAQLPWRRQILEGMLGADVIGFQTRIGAENFRRLCKRFLGLTNENGVIPFEGREVVTREFPISIDFARFDALAVSGPVRRHAGLLRARLGESRRVILGVDRLDYTKGIGVRIDAVRELLHLNKHSADDIVFVQVAVPSRERVEEYQDLRSEVEQMVGRVNGEFGQIGRAPIEYFHRSVPIEELVALYIIADVMLVTPLRDGMNLVAKEYAASRTDGTGVLILSEFAGAAKELREALIVNPHDVDAMANALDTALRMSKDEQQSRMHAMRETIRTCDVHHWARTFFECLAS